MADMSWEHAAEARAALNAIVSDPDHGLAALSSAQTMSNLLKDLLPDAPREKSMLVAAAEAGLASSLRDHVAQGMDPSTAIRLTASSFSASTPFTPDACNWVAAEIAIALGISTPAEAGAALTPAGGPAAGPAARGYDGQGAVTQLPAGYQQGQPQGYQQACNLPTQQYQQPAGVGAGYGQPGYGQAGYGQGGYGQPGGGLGAGPGYVRPGPARRSKRGIIAAGALAAAAAVVIAVVVLQPGPTPPARHHKHHTIPVTVPVESLDKVINPVGLPPIGTKCVLGGLAGLQASTVVARKKCNTTVKSLYVWAYQFDSAPDYQRGFSHLQSYLVFKPAQAGTSCPPGASSTSGATNWRSSNPKYHSYTGQYLDCLTIHGTYGKEVTYLWTLPSQHIVFLAQSWDTNIPFKTLDNWWAHLSYG